MICVCRLPNVLSGYVLLFDIYVQMARLKDDLLYICLSWSFGILFHMSMADGMKDCL